MRVGYSRQLATAVHATHGNIVATCRTPEHGQRMPDTIPDRYMPAAVADGHQPGAARTVRAQAHRGVRSRQSERREQQPEKSGQPTQAGLLLGFSYGNRKITGQTQNSTQSSALLDTTDGHCAGKLRAG